MAKRLESPSSINTFKQCQRKYYYQYVEKLPTSSSIHLVRGNIVHSTLEDFYDVNVEKFTKEDYTQKFSSSIQKLLFYHWGEAKDKLSRLNLSNDKLKFYFEESMLMTLNWHKYFLQDFSKKINDAPLLTMTEIFKELTPIRELEYKSEKCHVRGFIDVIKPIGNTVHIIDYKTNSRSDMKQSIIRQLSIYALMYQEKHGVLPEKVGAFFVRDKLKMIPVTEEMVLDARVDIEQIHAHTSSTEKINDYRKNITPLCKWRTGQCDFYETCKPHQK